MNTLIVIVPIYLSIDITLCEEYKMSKAAKNGLKITLEMGKHARGVEFERY